MSYTIAHLLHRVKGTLSEARPGVSRGLAGDTWAYRVLLWK